ncbi:hypothetical protein [Aureivirga sp. CE67]|uniref:hypothetical protein n=1 Tax=Aureivirga sp. CE67 TaxID=1788983 RepID=UPI0018CB7077|nr:hypothetical protein [Aureivirga sp. CE67]
MKKLFLIALFIVNFINAQITKNNETTFELRKTSLKFISSNQVETSKYFITVNNSEKDLDYLKKLNKKEILVLIQDEKYDWRINLLLYQYYKKNAIMFFAFDLKTRKDWIDYFKEEDQKYWTINLEKCGLCTE